MKKSQEKHKQSNQEEGVNMLKGKAIVQKGDEVSDLTKEYRAPFTIRSHEEGKKFHSLRGRRFSLPTFFDNGVLYDLGVEEDMEILSDRLGWTKFFKLKHDTLYELTLEFYTTFTILNEDPYLFSCRLFGRKFHVDSELMSVIFGFPVGGLKQPPNDFVMPEFWKRLTQFNCCNEEEGLVSGLIRDPAYLLMHKFMAHNIFGKQSSAKVSRDELFMLWCMHTNTKISSTHFVVQTIWQVVQAKKTPLSMGHIIVALGQYFKSFNATFSTKGMGVFESHILGERALIKAEIMTEWRTLKDVENRKCYEMRKDTLKHLSQSSSSGDEESEGNSNEGRLKRKAVENETTTEQMLLLRMDMLESELCAKMNEIRIMKEDLKKLQGSRFKRLKTCIESNDPKEPISPPLQ